MRKRSTHEIISWVLLFSLFLFFFINWLFFIHFIDYWIIRFIIVYISSSIYTSLHMIQTPYCSKCHISPQAFVLLFIYILLLHLTLQCIVIDFTEISVFLCIMFMFFSTSWNINSCFNDLVCSDSLGAVCTNKVYLALIQWHPTPVLLPGKSHGWRSLVGCSPWGH